MKKLGFMTLLITASLVLFLAFPVAAAGPNAPAAVAAPTISAAPATVAVPAAALPEGHPHIHEALEGMRAAKHQLESAEHDFEGHRVEAIKHLDMAIHEAEICEHMR
jgi:hypothetical protein